PRATPAPNNGTMRKTVVRIGKGRKAMKPECLRLRQRGQAALVGLMSVVALLLAPQGHAQGASVPEGHAAVIAQGIAQLSAQAMAWRVALRQPDPAEEHPPIARHVGFTLPRRGQLLVTGSERKNDLTLLAPGQASFAREG